MVHMHPSASLSRVEVNNKHLREIMRDPEDMRMRRDVELGNISIGRVIDFLFNGCVFEFYEIIL